MSSPEAQAKRRVLLKVVTLFLSWATLPLLADLTAGVNAYETKDFRKAATELMPLADKGDTTAQYYIGIMSFFGEGLSRDYKKGIKWLSSAAEGGIAHAAAMLGWFYTCGPNTPWHSEVPTNLVTATSWLRLAVKGDDEFGENTLASLYKDGRGVPEDFSEAARLYRLAAEQGDPDSQCSLGFLYLNGEGVVKDYVQAHLWFNLRGAHGEEIVGSCPGGSARRSEILWKA